MKKHKLVRDKIPQFINESGKKPNYHVATPSAQRHWLYQKMMEEVNELLTNPCEEEAADVYEVWRAMCTHYNFNLDAVIEHARQKRELRGGFNNRIILEIEQQPNNPQPNPSGEMQ